MSLISIYLSITRNMNYIFLKKFTIKTIVAMEQFEMVIIYNDI